MGCDAPVAKKKFLLRLDPEIYEAVQRWAADEWRSVNGQIEYVLRDCLRRAGRLPSSGRPGRKTADANGEGDVRRQGPSSRLEDKG